MIYGVVVSWYRDELEINVPALGRISWVSEAGQVEQEARRIIAQCGAAAEKFDIEIEWPGPQP
jgi:hypothetical protein